MNIKYNTLIFLIFVFSLFKQSFAHELNKDEINSFINNFILKNPQVIEKALQNLNLERSKKNFEIALNELRKISNPKLSSANPDVTIYEFFDYNCGYCKSVMQNIFNIYKKDKKVEIVFVEYPILSKSSLSAAVASLAARNQKKYFEFHSKLMNHSGKIDDKLLLSFAKELKIDVKKLKSDYSNEKLMLIINKNRDIANRLNLRGTPAFIIGNKIYPGAMSEKDIEKAIALERKR
jgi:protein-disulfide isomerase